MCNNLFIFVRHRIHSKRFKCEHKNLSKEKDKTEILKLEKEKIKSDKE